MGKHGSGAQDGAEQIYPYCLLPLIPRHVLDASLRPVDTRVVDEHIDTREALQGSADDRVRRVRLGDVCPRCRDPGRVGGDRFELRSGPVERSGIASADEHPSTRGEERPRDLAPESVATPGDDRGPAGEDVGHPRAPSLT